VPLRHNIASSLLATQHYHKWLDGISDAFAYCLRKLRQYAQAYAYRGLRAFVITWLIKPQLTRLLLSWVSCGLVIISCKNKSKT